MKPVMPGWITALAHSRHAELLHKAAVGHTLLGTQRPARLSEVLPSRSTRLRKALRQGEHFAICLFSPTTLNFETLRNAERSQE